MKSIKSITVINASQEHCFNVSHDYSIRSEWDYFIKETGIIEKGDSGPKRVWVKDRRGLYMEVVYTNYNPPTVASMKMVSGPFFFSKFGGAWIFKKSSPSTTVATFSYSFALKRWLFPLFTSFIVKFILNREIKNRLDSFKRYCEKTYI